MRRLILLVIVAVAVPAAGDVVYLRDGTWVAGTVKKTEAGYAVTNAKGVTTEYKQADVLSIELVAAKLSPNEQAIQRLASLRRAVAFQEDPKAIIQRYEEFLKNYRDTPAADEAGKDLELWKDRQDKGLVKFGDKWISPAEREQLLAQTVNQIDKARALLKLNHIREAEQIVQQVLDIDPKNASALYVRGVILYREDQLGPARKAFETVNALIPDHGPTLNNLGVILWRQNQVVASMNFYDQAMLASPNNREILSNVAEALQALPAQFKDNTVVKRVARRFQEQDATLQQQMSQQGLYRWGGSWLNREQMEELKKAEKEVKDKLDAMAAEFDKSQNRIREIDSDIEANNRYILSIEQNSILVDQTTGVVTRLAFPQRYYDVQRDNERLHSSREELVRRLDQLRVTARRTQQQLPAPKYTGLQQLAGEEFTPLKVLTVEKADAGGDKPAPPAPAVPVAPSAQVTPPKPAPPRDLVAGPMLPATQPTTAPDTP